MKTKDAKPSIKRIMLLQEEKATAGMVVEIQERLQQHGHRVECCSSVEVPPEDLMDYDLVLVGVGTWASHLRLLPVPLIVFRPEAAAALGMTGSHAEADFGASTKSEFIQVRGNDEWEHEISGRHHVVTGGSIGWGKPGEDASIKAIISGAPSKPVIFSYEGGVAMPGLKSPHRRVAFLLPIDAEAGFTASAWDLFDAAVGWALSPSEAGEEKDAKSSGVGYIEGQPTKVLSVDEYREWVEEKVANRLLLKLGLGGSIGISTVVAAAIWLKSTISGHIDHQVQTAVTNQVNIATKSLVAEFSSENVNKRVGESLAQIFFEKATLEARMLENAKTALTNALANQQANIVFKADTAITNALATQVANLVSNVEAAVDQQAQKTMKIELPKIALLAQEAASKAATNFSEIVRPNLLRRVDDADLDLEQRMESMRLLPAFGGAPELYRDSLLRIIQNRDSKSSDLRALALRYCVVTPGDTNNSRLLNDVLIGLSAELFRLSYQDPFELRTATIPSKPNERNNSGNILMDSYATFLGQFPESFSLNLTAFLSSRTRAREAPRTFRVIGNALEKMKGEQPSLELARLISQTNQPALRKILLQNIGQRPSSLTNADVRWTVLIDTWSGIKKTVSAEEQNWKRVRDAIAATNVYLVKQALTNFPPPTRSPTADLISRELLRASPYSSGSVTQDWSYIKRLASESVGDYLDEQFALQRLVRTNDWPQIEKEWWSAEVDDLQIKARLQGILFGAWLSRLGQDGAQDLSDATTDHLLSKTGWYSDRSLIKLLESSLDEYQGTNRGLGMAKCFEAAIAQIKNTNSLFEVVPDALRLASREDRYSSTPYTASAAFLKESFEVLRAPFGSNRCSQIFPLLLQFVVNADDPRALLPVFEEAWPLLTSTCPDGVAAARKELVQVYLRLARPSPFDLDATGKTNYLQRKLAMDRVLSLDPSNPIAFHGRGLYNIALTNLDEAESDINKAIELRAGAPRDVAGSKENLGLVFIGRKQWDRVLTNCIAIEKEFQKDFPSLPGYPAASMSWNTLCKWIAADKLKRADDLEDARRRTRELSSRFDVDDLEDFLSPDLHGYINNAVQYSRQSVGAGTQ